MIKIVKKFLHIIKSCYLCIRFPFLYPRNRFTDKHYNNQKLLDKINKYLSFAEKSFFIRIYDSKSDRYLSAKKSYGDVFVASYPFFRLHGHNYSLRYNNGVVYLYLDNNIIYSINVDDYIGSGSFSYCEFIIKYNLDIDPFKDFSYNTSICIALVGDNLEYNKNISFNDCFITLVVDKFYMYKYKFFNFIHNKILQLIHCIPSRTELDAMPEGWRKSFGIKMCKEIKQELKKHNYLYQYRITQIKEKFGSLRWYDVGSPKGCINKIIDKYESISRYTCINCGDKAKYISKGWVSPYCENCISNHDDYNLIHE